MSIKNKKTLFLSLVGVTSILYIVLMSSEQSETVVDSEQLLLLSENSRLPDAVVPHASASTITPLTLNEANHKKPIQKIPNPIDRIRMIQNKTELHKVAIQDYERFTRYPSNNVAISTIEADPLVRSFKIDERTTLNEEKTAALTVWSNQVTYQRDEEVNVFAKLSNEYGDSIATQFKAELIYNNKQRIGSFDLADIDQNGTHQLSFHANEIDGNKLESGLYKVIIANSSNELVDGVVFMLADPAAGFTGEYRDHISAKGDLVIEAEVEVTNKDRFYFQASLYTELGDPIGSAQMTFPLEKGRHWVALEFFGLMVRDSEVSGPYLLKNIALARVTMPMQRAPLTQPQYLTKPYELTEFSNTRYEDIAALQ